jgi:LysM repeat protein
MAPTLFSITGLISTAALLANVLASPVPQTAAPTTAVPSCVTTYRSVAGDTCASIGAIYGISAGAILSANSFLNCNDICKYIDQVCPFYLWMSAFIGVNTPVCIPYYGGVTTSPGNSAPKCRAQYTSVAGDTCASIGSKYGVSASAIYAANTFLNCNDICEFH